MTEADWLACTDLDALLAAWPAGGLSVRKRRLFACACCRRIEGLFADPRLTRAVEVAERFADGLAGRDALVECTEALDRLGREYNLYRFGPRDYTNAAIAACQLTLWPDEDPGPSFLRAAHYAAQAVALHSREVSAGPSRAERSAHLRLFRDVFGNPFRPASADPAWSHWASGTAAKLARAIYEGRRFGDLPILADALEDAGCADEGLLNHCREPAEHACGCWVLDLVLGRS